MDHPDYTDDQVTEALNVARAAHPSRNVIVSYNRGYGRLTFAFDAAVIGEWCFTIKVFVRGLTPAEAGKEAADAAQEVYAEHALK